MTPDTPDNEYETALRAWFAPTPAKPATDEGEDAGEGGWFGLGPRKTPEHLEALERVKEWVRERFKLAEDSAIVVSELACTIPGCAPLETAVAFWEGETRYHFKMLRPVEDVTVDHLPYAWQKESMLMPEGFGCECC